MRAVIVSIGSDIGHHLAKRWLGRDWEVWGTYRTWGPGLMLQKWMGARLTRCDLSHPREVDKACADMPDWNVLVMCPGTQEPVAPFAECHFPDWQRSVEVNFLSQMRILHGLLPRRDLGPPTPCVVLLAGGQEVRPRYTAYGVSKLALVNMAGALRKERPDTRFCTFAPGWVKTKIHRATLDAGERAGDNYQRTLDKLAGNECTPMETVLDCLDRIVDSDDQGDFGWWDFKTTHSAAAS